VRGINIQVIGGPRGTGPVHLVKGASEAHMMESNDEVEYATMHSRAFEEKKMRLESEKLFARCDFISGLAEKSWL
jgi:hypothetical protein